MWCCSVDDFCKLQQDNIYFGLVHVHLLANQHRFVWLSCKNYLQNPSSNVGLMNYILYFIFTSKNWCFIQAYITEPQQSHFHKNTHTRTHMQTLACTCKKISFSNFYVTDNLNMNYKNNFAHEKTFTLELSSHSYFGLNIKS